MATCSTGSFSSSPATRRTRAERWRSAASTSRPSSSTPARSRPGSTGSGGVDRRRLRGHRRLRGGKDQRRDLHELESAACPGAGACGGQFTANTMSGDPRLPRPLALRRERDPGDPSRQGAGGIRGRPARRAARPRQRHAALDRDARVVRERRCLGRGDGRLDERRPPPRRDRARLRARVHDRRLRAHLGEDADHRRHEAVGPLARERHVPGRRWRARGARAEEGGAPAPRRAGPSTAARSARSPTPPSRPRARRSSSRSRRRSRHAVASRSSTATSRPTAARSSSPATTGPCTAALRACSTPRRRRSRRSRPARSSPATSS